MSCNERLLDAMNRATTTPVALAERIAVDPKTVERWVTQGRVPYPRHRHELAALLGESEAWLWPDAYSADRVGQAARSEVVTVYGHRYQIPAELWARLVGEATTFLDILVYAGLFLPEQTAGLSERLIDQAAAGVKSGSCWGIQPPQLCKCGAPRKASATLWRSRSETPSTCIGDLPTHRCRFGYIRPPSTPRCTEAMTR